MSGLRGGSGELGRLAGGEGVGGVAVGRGRARGERGVEPAVQLGHLLRGLRGDEPARVVDEVGGRRARVRGQPGDPRQRGPLRRRHPQRAPDDEAQLRLALAVRAVRQDGRVRHRLPPEVGLLVGGVPVVEGVAVGAVAREVDRPPAQPVAAAEPQRRQRPRGSGERGPQRHVGRGLGRRVRGVEGLLGRHGVAGALGDQAPSRPRRHRLVEVDVGVAGHRRRRRALDVPLVAPDDELVLGPVGLGHDVAAHPLAQAAEAGAVAVDVEAVAAGDVLGPEVGGGPGGHRPLGVGLPVGRLDDALDPVPVDDGEAAAAQAGEAALVGRHRPGGRLTLEVAPGRVHRRGGVDHLQRRAVDVELVEEEALGAEGQLAGGEVGLAAGPRDEQLVLEEVVRPRPVLLLLHPGVERVRDDQPHPPRAVAGRRSLDDDVDGEAERAQQPGVVAERPDVAVVVDPAQLGRRQRTLALGAELVLEAAAGAVAVVEAVRRGERQRRRGVGARRHVAEPTVVAVSVLAVAHPVEELVVVPRVGAHPAELLDDGGQRSGGHRRQRLGARQADRPVGPEDRLGDVVRGEGVPLPRGQVGDRVVEDGDLGGEDAVVHGLVGGVGVGVGLGGDPLAGVELDVQLEVAHDLGPPGEEREVGEEALAGAVGGQPRRDEDRRAQQPAVLRVQPVGEDGEQGRLGHVVLLRPRTRCSSRPRAGRRRRRVP